MICNRGLGVLLEIITMGLKVKTGLEVNWLLRRNMKIFKL